MDRKNFRISEAVWNCTWQLKQAIEMKPSVYSLRGADSEKTAISLDMRTIGQCSAPG